MNNQAFKVVTTTNEEVLLLPNPQGLQLNYITCDDQGAVDSFNVGLKFASLKKLLKSLQYGQKYIIDDSSLFVWEESRSLRMQFKSNGIEKKCEINPDETAKLVQFLSQYIAQKRAR